MFNSKPNYPANCFLQIFIFCLISPFCFIFQQNYEKLRFKALDESNCPFLKSTEFIEGLKVNVFKISNFLQ